MRDLETIIVLVLLAFSFISHRFNKVNHGILVSKLACYGLRGMAGTGLDRICEIEGSMLRWVILGQVLEILKLV